MRRTLAVRTPCRLAPADDAAIEKLPGADIMKMDVGLKEFSLGTKNAQSCPLWVSLSAVALVVLIFVGDWVTPATVVVGLAYEAPVVFAGLKGTARLTVQVTLLAVMGLTLGWFMDLAADSYHFSADRIENRLLSVLSLLIASCLTLRAQRINPTRPS